jgi:DnaJ-domain-containing protein 1
MSFGRRLGRFARGFVSSNIGEERLQEAIRQGRERGETLRGAFEAAWKGAQEEWQAAEERRAAEEAREAADGPGAPSGDTAGNARGGARGSARGSATGGSRRESSRVYIPRRYPPEVLTAYHRLGLQPGSSLEEANRKRRELVKRHHPDRFSDAAQRARAERVTAEINAAHDTIERHLVGRGTGRATG